MTNDEKMSFMCEFWESNLHIIQQGLTEIIRSIPRGMKELPQSNDNDFKKCVAVEFTQQLKPLLALIATMRAAGVPSSLIFANKDVRIDLLQVKDIDGMEAINQILDSSK